MDLGFIKPFSTGTIGVNFGLRPKSNAGFKSNPAPDTFETTSLNSYTTEYKLQKAVNENPKIKAILERFNVPCSLNMEAVYELQNGHAADTKEIARGIIANLPFSLKDKVNKDAVEKAAYLHDTGKSLIPVEILNKSGALNPEETEIMHTHSELSYELLKDSGLDKKTLSLIRNHHQNAKKTGYPFVDKSFFADIDQQIVSMADKYSALTEKRSYKSPMANIEALTILAKDVNEGKYSQLVFNALVKYSSSYKTAAYQKV